MLYAFPWVFPRRLNFTCRRFETLFLFHLHTYPPLKMEQPECPEMSERKILTPGNYTEESIKLELSCIPVNNLFYSSSLKGNLIIPSEPWITRRQLITDSQHTTATMHLHFQFLYSVAVLQMI
jgi:hypothetical protein